MNLPHTKPCLSLRLVTRILLAAFALVSDSQPCRAANAPLPGWSHSGVLTVLTTPEGANLPAGAQVEEFPLLVRLNGEWFDFSQAKPDGADVRFTTSDGKLLSHQIDEWDAASGSASVWVRVPLIKGNDRLPLIMHWGKPDAASTSDGKAVFNESNGYLGVWHLGDTVRDDAGALKSVDSGTVPTTGMIGKGRKFTEGKRISCGDKITGYPTANAPHTTGIWVRAAQSNVSLIGWGTNQRQGKVVMQLRGPIVYMDCWFSDGNVESRERVALNEWTHIVHAYESGNARVYVNGALAGKAGKGTPLNVPSPASLVIGGWAGGERFVGDLDEARVSKVTRSADWVRLEYENQKPLQTLVGPMVRAGKLFSVTPQQASIAEGSRANFVLQADGALKIYWSLQRDGREERIAVDRLALDFAPGRVAADTSMTLRVNAVFPEGVRTREIPVTVKNTIPDPVFTLEAPATWDGRTAIDLVPRITNLDAMQRAGAGDVQMQWSARSVAVVKEAEPGKLRLLAAQNSGSLTITATLSNGGTPVTNSATIAVTEPARDAWVRRAPERDEKPEEGQFYARDDQDEGTLYYRGKLTEQADEVFLKVFADDKRFAEVKAKPDGDLRYELTAALKPGLVKYRVEFGTRTGGAETVLDRVGDLVCGDAFLIEGQSNAEATALDKGANPPCETNEWIRSFARSPLGDAEKRSNLWRRAGWKDSQTDNAAGIGWWGMELAKRLVASQKVPIFILNGAVGGTRIDQHQRNPQNPADLNTIYGRWLKRLQLARLTHGIRAIFWHQGESDQPAATPSGDFGWVNYHQFFIEMSAGWRRDLPNAHRYFMFQVWPNACAMGGSDGAGDRLREQQRMLPALFSKLSIMSTLGVRPAGGCHYPLEGYNEIARLIQPLVERDVYGQKPGTFITPPNLRSARFTSAAADTIALEFDQPVKWSDPLATQFYLDGEKDKVVSGSVAGTVLTLKLREASRAKTITYLQEKNWSQDNLLWGTNDIAALTFCEVPLAPPQ